MNEIINCSDEAAENIEVALERIQELENVLAEKKGDNSKIKRLFLSAVYIVMMIGCIYLVLRHEQIDLAPFDKLTGCVIVIIAGSSSALFMALLLLNNLLEGKYYKVIFDGERKVNHIIRNLQNAKSICKSYYGLLDGSADSTDHTIELGDNIYIEIDNIERKIKSLEKGKFEIISNVLSALYYVAAITVGAMFVLMTQDGVVTMMQDTMLAINIAEKKALLWPKELYTLCAFVGIFVGPLILRYYFEKIKLIHLMDGLVFLIAGSGFIGFCAAFIAVGLIALVIGLVIGAISFIAELLAGLIALVIIIAIIFGLLNGG